MATITPNLGLSLIATGESVGTWGVPLNQNFTEVDILGGEIHLGRGTKADLNTRFSDIELELSSAYGDFGSLADRLDVMINPDGTIKLEDFPRATPGTFGVVRLSHPPANPLQPVVVSDNDPRLPDVGQYAELTGGGDTQLHTHKLADGASDLVVTATELNRFYGINSSVTAVKMNDLMGGAEVSHLVHSHSPATNATGGFVQLSKSPDAGQPAVAVGVNDDRLLTTGQRSELIGGTVTNAHKHNLVDGADDVVTTASQLNQLAAISTSVDSINLNLLVEQGNASGLHHHNDTYPDHAYMNDAIHQSESDSAAALADHNTNNMSHQGQDMDLARLTASRIDQADAGVVHQIDPHATEPASAMKWVVADHSGSPLINARADGTLTARSLIVGGAVVDGASVADMGGEIGDSRGGFPTLSDRLDHADSSASSTASSISGHIADELNPHQTTISQAIASDVNSGTSLTLQNLNRLVDGTEPGSNADGLHYHKATSLALDSILATLDGVLGADTGFSTANERFESLESDVAEALSKLTPAISTWTPTGNIDTVNPGSYPLEPAGRFFVIEGLSTPVGGYANNDLVWFDQNGGFQGRLGEGKNPDSISVIKVNSNYTLSKDDMGRLITCIGTNDIVVTIAKGLSKEFNCMIKNSTADKKVNVIPATGVTMDSQYQYNEIPVTGRAALMPEGTVDKYDLFGDIF